MDFFGKTKFRLAQLLFLMGTMYLEMTEVRSKKVLGIFEWPGRSHFIMCEVLMKELAARGHEVTVVSHFPQKKPLANYTDISLEGSVPVMTHSFSVQNMLDFTTLRHFHYFWEENVDRSTQILNHSIVRKLLNSSTQYDLVVLEIGGTDMSYGLAWKFQAPVIGITTFSRMWNAQFRLGFMESPAYFPLWVTSYSTNMSFWERLVNTVLWVYFNIGEYAVLHQKINAFWHTVLGSTVPQLDDLQTNTSLIFVNSHFTLNGALPALPSIIEVGGMHIAENRVELPQDLRLWLDSAADGVVYVSFGSLARVNDMPLEQLDVLARVLGTLEQRVVWKCDGNVVMRRLGRTLAGNTFTASWLPQNEVLAHPKVRVFVSHGGLMGTQEAVYWGKPMLVIPFFADQKQNARNLVERGMAVQLHFEDINEESFDKALRAVLFDKKYSLNAVRLSTLFRDRPRTPLQEAVYWSEYVMRYRGAPQLRSGSVHLRWWQHCLLDVVAAILFAAAITISALRLILRHLLRYLSRNSLKAKRS